MFSGEQSTFFEKVDVIQTAFPRFRRFEKEGKKDFGFIVFVTKRLQFNQMSLVVCVDIIQRKELKKKFNDVKSQKEKKMKKEDIELET